MDYNYNYRYLQQYMDSHHLAKKDLLEALGCKDYVSLNKWLEGKVPVHITAMLRFCNYYNVPLANFFCDSDGMPCDFAPTLPDKDVQLSPTDGYGIREGVGRGIVDTHIESRHPSSAAATKAVAAGLKLQAEQRNRRDAALAQMEGMAHPNPPKGEGVENAPAVTPDSSQMETILRLKLDQSQELRKAEQDHRDKEDLIRERYDDERKSLLRIIEQQGKEIARLSSVNHVRAYGNIQGDHGFIGVAENIHDNE